MNVKIVKSSRYFSYFGKTGMTEKNKEKIVCIA